MRFRSKRRCALRLATCRDLIRASFDSRDPLTSGPFCPQRCRQHAAVSVSKLSNEDAVDAAGPVDAQNAPPGLGNYKTVSTAPTALIFCSKKTQPKQKRARVSTVSWDFTKPIKSATYCALPKMRRLSSCVSACCGCLGRTGRCPQPADRFRTPASSREHGLGRGRSIHRRASVRLGHVVLDVGQQGSGTRRRIVQFAPKADERDIRDRYTRSMQTDNTSSSRRVTAS
jgi:hypothetical protein